MMKEKWDEKITSRFIPLNVDLQSESSFSDKTWKHPEWILSERAGCLSETPVVCLLL